MATSATGGYIDPTTGAIYDDALDDLLQQVIAAVTGLPGAMVRPRFVLGTPPQQPEFTENWVSFGVSGPGEPDTFAYERHDPTGEGTTFIERDEILELRASFYGPAASALVARFRDGLQLSQNRDALWQAGIGLIEIRPSARIPALQNESWVNRVNITALLRRRTSRQYAVLNIQSAEVIINNEFTEVTVTVNQ